MTTIVLSFGEPEGEQPEYPISIDRYDANNNRLDQSLTGMLPANADTVANEVIEELRSDGDPRVMLYHIGRKLYDLIAACPLAGSLLTELQSNSQQRVTARQQLRTYLDIKAKKLAQLPWELMLDQEGRSVFCLEGNWPMRGNPTATEDDEARATPPIRLLIVRCQMNARDVQADNAQNGTPPWKSADDFAQDEIDAIHRAVGAYPGIWHTFVLANPSYEDLLDRLETFKPDMVHFIGETIGTAEEPEFILNLSGQRDPVAIKRLGELLLRQVPKPRILVFNGCHTTGIITTGAFQHLYSRAVITNHGSVYGQPSVLFSSHFYTKLAQTGNLAEAMWFAREKLLYRYPEDYSDWGLPALTVFGIPQEVLTPSLSSFTDQLNNSDINFLGNRRQRREVVDRVGTRQQIWQAIYGQRNDRRNLILVSGEEGLGKSTLLRSALLTCKLYGSAVVMLNLKGDPRIAQPDGSYSARDVLRLICQELERWFSDESREVLRKLTVRLEENVGQLAAGALANSMATSPLDSEFDLLITLLRQEAREREIIIALDHVESINWADRQGILLHRLLRRVAEDGGRVFFLIAANNAVDALRIDPEEDVWSDHLKRVTVAGFSRQHMRMLWHEWGARKDNWKDERDRREWNDWGQRWTPDPSTAPRAGEPEEYEPSYLIMWTKMFERHRKARNRR